MTFPSVKYSLLTLVLKVLQSGAMFMGMALLRLSHLPGVPWEMPMSCILQSPVLSSLPEYPRLTIGPIQLSAIPQTPGHQIMGEKISFSYKLNNRVTVHSSKHNI